MLSKDILLQEGSYLEKEEELYVFFLFFSSLSAKLFLCYKQRECHDENGKFRKKFSLFSLPQLAEIHFGRDLR